MKCRTILAVCMVFPAILARAQHEHSAAPAATGPDPSYTSDLTPPMPVSGLQMPLMFSSETPRSNFVTGSLQLDTGYDDNVLITPSNHLGDVGYLILPRIEISQTRERWNLNFEYSLGLTINQRVVERNQTAQNLQLLFAYRLSPHVTAQIHENFVKANSLFSDRLGGSSVVGPGPLQQPNPFGVTPLADRTANATGLDLTYQFSASSLVGASGDFHSVTYNAPEGSTSPVTGLIDSAAWGGNAFYARQFSGRHWAGVTYNFQRLLFDPGNRTDVNRTLFFYSVSTGPQMRFSIWAGPERTASAIPDAVVPVTALASSTSPTGRWGIAGGADLSWQGKRTSARLGYLRQTSDGGGLAQAVNLQQIDANIHQRLTERWTAIGALGYAKNDPLNLANGSAPFHTWLGHVGLDCVLTDNLLGGLRYGRYQLEYTYSASPAVSASRNRVWISLAYSLSRPLGR